jgi:hypothetical protein
MLCFPCGIQASDHKARKQIIRESFKEEGKRGKWNTYDEKAEGRDWGDDAGVCGGDMLAAQV